MRAVQPAFENRQAMLAPFRSGPGSRESETPRGSPTVRASSSTTLGVKACREDRSACELNGGLQRREPDPAEGAPLRPPGADDGRQDRQNLETVARGLSRIPGRKTVVFMTEGFFVEDSRGVLETIAAQAARSGITIYSIDGRGLIGAPSATSDAVTDTRARSTAFDTGEDGPTILTEGTGGFMVRNIDDMSRAFGLIVRDTSTYYVIGYQPANPTMDGKFRRIEVKTRVAGPEGPRAQELRRGRAPAAGKSAGGREIDKAQGSRLRAQGSGLRQGSQISDRPATSSRLLPEP